MGLVNPDFGGEELAVLPAFGICDQGVVHAVQFGLVVLVELAEATEELVCLCFVHLDCGVLFKKYFSVLHEALGTLLDELEEHTHHVVRLEVLDCHDFRGEVFKCHLQGACGDGDDSRHAVTEAVEGRKNLLFGEVRVIGVENDGFRLDIGIGHDCIDQYAVGSHGGRCKFPVHAGKVDELVDVVDMEGEALVHVGDEDDRRALDLAAVGDLAVVCDHLGDDHGAFFRVLHVDVVLVLDQDVVAVGEPVCVAVLEAGDGTRHLLSLAVFKPCIVVGISDQGFLVGKGRHGTDFVQMRLQLAVQIRCIVRGL